MKLVTVIINGFAGTQISNFIFNTDDMQAIRKEMDWKMRALHPIATEYRGVISDVKIHVGDNCFVNTVFEEDSKLDFEYWTESLRFSGTVKSKVH